LVTAIADRARYARVTVLGEIKARVAELPDGFEAHVETQLAAVSARWPQGPEPDASFSALVVARLSPQPRIEDLYLAWWCSSGDAQAIAAFEAAFADDLRAMTARFRDLPADELRQHLRIKLFVGSAESAPKIRDYSGTGSLRSWLRVTAVRSFIDLTRSTRAHRYEQELDAEDLLGFATPQHVSIRSELAAAVKSAFAAAVAQLAPRQRVFLRHAYVDHHTLDQIAAHYSVHRATVARTLAAAREQLISETRARLVGNIGIDSEELTSVIRMLDSRIDLSLSRVLA
jgi:RNA polymerase sigma-70 factor, ECF subfamily